MHWSITLPERQWRRRNVLVRSSPRRNRRHENLRHRRRRHRRRQSYSCASTPSAWPRETKP
jgi:hypothetical protein